MKVSLDCRESGGRGTGPPRSRVGSREAGDQTCSTMLRGMDDEALGEVSSPGAATCAACVSKA